MSVALLFFVLIGGVVAIIDYKKEVIPDKIMLPSIVILALISHFEGSLELNHLLTALLVGLFLLYCFTFLPILEAEISGSGCFVLFFWVFLIYLFFLLNPLNKPTPVTLF